MTDQPYDSLETRDPAGREAALFAALPGAVAWARQASPAFAEILQELEPTAVDTRAALARLPVTRKSDLLARQRAQVAADPFGGFSAAGWANVPRVRRARRVFQSPGPIYEPEGDTPDGWRSARALYAAGFRAGDLVHNAFSYHLTPAGSLMESGAFAIGCAVFPGGVGQTELQLQAMAELKADAYVGTPSFLRILVEKAAAQGLALPFMKKALVSGEAFPAALRDWLRDRGIAAYQCYATADLGLIAYETVAREGLVLDEGVIVEIVRPGTGDPVPDGEVGEVVVTTLNEDHPLVRFGTGDLSAVLSGQCPTGRTNARLRGWLGRADQTAKVRGMFVHPGHVAEVVRRYPAVRRARLVIDGEMARDSMTLQVEVDGTPETLAERLGESLRDVTRLRGEVELCGVGTLPNDGQVIVDRRAVG